MNKFLFNEINMEYLFNMILLIPDMTHQSSQMKKKGSSSENMFDLILMLSGKGDFGKVSIIRYWS